MTATVGGPAAPVAESGGPGGQRLLVRVLDALLREDHRGLLSRSVDVDAPDLDRGRWLAVDSGDPDGGRLLLPVAAGGFLCDYAVRRPLLARRVAATTVTAGDLDGVLALLRPGPADPEAVAGFDVFAAECRAAADAESADAEGGTVGHTEREDPEPGALGWAASLRYDALAARCPHPVYPSARARPGIDTAQMVRFAPEFGGSFRLRWIAMPAERMHRRGSLPGVWPSVTDLGLPPERAATHLPLPVHPLSWPAALAALTETGLHTEAIPITRAHLAVRPTLSMRTVSPLAEPGTHIKVPLPTATLGARNRRSLAPDALHDAAVTHRLLAQVLAREPRFGARILLADEATYAHVGHEFLSVGVRRHPRALSAREIVPVAALLAGGGTPVICRLADRHYGGDLRGLLADYLTLLFGFHTTLWLRYGMTLAAHQQNVSLVLDPAACGPARLALLYKDNDSPRVDLARLSAALGPGAAAARTYRDRRILAADAGELADMFTTITVHLCAAAPAFGLARTGWLSMPWARRALRGGLEASMDGLHREPAVALMRHQVLDAARLPVKAMLTAGTLLPKERTGARDINTYYVRTGPNYLQAAP